MFLFFNILYLFLYRTHVKYFPKLSATLLIQDASTIIYKKSYNKVSFSKLNFNKVDKSNKNHHLCDHKIMKIMKQIFSQRLKSARLMNGLSMDSLCEKINNIVSKQSISKYEKGIMMPESTILIALSKALNVNVDFFFRPYNVTVEDIEFRKKSKLKASSLKSIKEKVIDEIERYMEIENLLHMENSFHIVYKDIIKEKNDAITVACRLRNDLKLGEDAISNITFLLEENGIKVVHLDAEVEFDGLSGFINKTTPFIIVNKNATAERQRFTALYELGYLLLNFAQELQDKEREKLCNVFVNEMLIPTSEFIRLIGISRKDISLQELIFIQMQFGISIDTLMHKAKEVGIITEQRYKGYCIKKKNSTYFSEQIKKTRYPQEQSYRFLGLVYKAISQEIISISKASSLLNCSVNEIHSSLNFI